MPRENSFSDSDGRSLTPDLDEEVEMITSPVDIAPPALPPLQTEAIGRGMSGSHGFNTYNVEQEGPLSAPASLREESRVRSPRSATSPREHPHHMTPRERFRSTVRKIIAMRRGSVAISRGLVGAEPGIDPRRESAYLTYGHIRQKCLIEIADYSSVRSSFGRMSNTEFIRLLSDSRASAKESWVKVRWINVGGISWDVISALAIKYDLHPLALEDLLHVRKAARSKADYYPKHLFLRILCHTLISDDEASQDTPRNSVTHLPRSESPISLDEDDDEDEYENSMEKNDEEQTVYGSQPASRFATKRSGTLSRVVQSRINKMNDLESKPGATFDLPSSRLGDDADLRAKNRKDARNIKLIRELKRGERVNVKISPMCIFLLRDGTVITIHQDTKLDFTAPITERLRQRDTGLRTSADASLLVESLLDLVVDGALQVVEEYQSKILKLEQAVLLKPSVKHVRRLHILQGDLILHKRTLEPIKTVIYGLRRYDVDRVAALSESLDPAVKVQGYMSHKSKIYLADVHDHMEYILSSLDMFAGISENLINYTFNMSSYEMNEVMRRLTLATIIFLPLTLLTGYFGMNFENMWSIMHGHSDVVFWIIALPLMAIVVPVFLWSDIKRMAHYLVKKTRTRKVKKKFKQA